MNLKQVLSKAAEGCESTSQSCSVIRPSKAGYSLLTAVLTQLVLPKLPQPVSGSGKKSLESKLRTTMSIGIGFLFEAAMRETLEADYPGYTVVEQPELKWKSFVGHADYMMVAPDLSEVIVVDAKAFDAPTLRDIKERKLNDNWGYPTQLAVYAMGVQEQFPDAKVVSAWYVWSVPNKKLFRVYQDFKLCQQLANVAQDRVEVYSQVKELLEKQDFRAAAELACTAVDLVALPNKSYFYGNLTASTAFHYNAYSELFYPMCGSDEDGYPLAGEELISLVEKLMRDAYEGNLTEEYSNYLASVS